MAVANHSIAIVISAVFVLPFFFILVTALMTQQQALTTHLWPSPFQWGNFAKVFSEIPLIRYTYSTLVYAVLATIGVVASSIPVAYALSRMSWRGRNVAFLLVISTLMLPVQVTIVPLYVVFVRLHWIGSLKPLIVPAFFGDAFTIFLLRQFFLTIPQELSDAARVDGGGEFRIMTRVIMPLAKPAIAAVALFQFLYCWNDFFGPLLYTREQPQDLDPGRRPVPVQRDGAPKRAVEHPDGRLGPVHAAGHRPVLPGPTGVRRGRHVDGREGLSASRCRRSARRIRHRHLTVVVLASVKLPG